LWHGVGDGEEEVAGGRGKEMRQREREREERTQGRGNGYKRKKNIGPARLLGFFERACDQWPCLGFVYLLPPFSNKSISHFLSNQTFLSFIKNMSNNINIYIYK